MRKTAQACSTVTHRWQRLRALAFTVLVSGAAACSAPREIQDVSYDARFQRTKLDLYLPDEEGLRPTVMLIHGGAWKYGDKGQMRRMARRLARSGYAVASVNYRLLPAGRFPRNFQDVACALAFLQLGADQYGIDPARIAVLGYSAGGHLTAMLGMSWDDPTIAPDCDAGPPTAPAAIVPGAAVYDFRGRDHALVIDYLGGSESEVPDNFQLASPMAQIGPGRPPALLITGGADWFVGIDDTREMGAGLRAAGNSAEVLTLAGGGHLLTAGPDPGDVQFGVSIETPEAWLALIDFLERTVGAP